MGNRRAVLVRGRMIDWSNWVNLAEWEGRGKRSLIW